MIYHYGYGYPGMMGGYGFGFGIFGIIVTLIFWVLIIWAIIAIIRALTGTGRSGYWHGHGHHGMYGRDDEAMRILRERYAKGEITKEEYDARKSDLMNM